MTILCGQQPTGSDRPRPPLRLADRQVVYEPSARPDWWVTIRTAGGPVSYAVGRNVYDELAEVLKPWAEL